MVDIENNTTEIYIFMDY